MRRITKNKKGMGDFATFIIVVIGLLLMAPIMLKIVNSILDPLETNLNATSTTAAANVAYVQGVFVTFWDYLIVIALLVNMVLLFVFSYLVDTNPVFLILYIIAGIVIMSLAPYGIEPAKQIFGMSAFSTEILELPLTSYVVTYFHMIIFAVFIVTGIILYAKFRGRASDL